MVVVFVAVLTVAVAALWYCLATPLKVVTGAANAAAGCDAPAYYCQTHGRARVLEGNVCERRNSDGGRTDQTEGA